MRAPACVILVAVFCPPAFAADVTVRSHETGVHDGKPWGESYTQYHSDLGLRVDVTRDGAPAPYMSFLLLRRPDRLFVVRGASVTAVERPQLEALERQARVAPAPAPPQPSPLGTRHTVGGHECAGYRLATRGQPTRYFCLAPPASLGLPPAFVADCADLWDLLARLTALSRDAKASATDAVNPYRIPAGYPVRIWDSASGDVTWEQEMLSVATGPIDARLFAAPDPGR